MTAPASVSSGRPAPAVNPLTGQPLEAWQVLVVGAPETGPRRTVVDTRPGAKVQPWIVPLALPHGGLYVDSGRPGGTYQGPQQLPELVVQGANWWPLVGLVVIAALGWLLNGRRWS
jgi:hypothetical protein